MTLHLEGIRPKVISEESASLLTDLMRFRHFKRYYFQIDFDKAKIQYLFTVMERLHPSFNQDLDTFTQYLRNV